MRLLIKRDSNHLVITEGKFVGDDSLPEFLKIPRVVERDDVLRIQWRSVDDDLILADEKDYEEINEHLKNISSDARPTHNLVSILKNIPTSAKPLPGIWSGYRSSIVQDSETRSLFKLKGVSLNPSLPQITDYDDSWVVQGGQFKHSSHFERIMSKRFNNVLREKGIQPVIEAKGEWKYPVRARKHALVGSIYEIQGDTRIDELMTILEQLAFEKMAFQKEEIINERQKRRTPHNLNYYGEKLCKRLSQFYHDCGFVTGRLKKLMDKSGQTWSSDKGSSNAHIGNIVCYNGTGNIKLGLVDFDASCDNRDFSKSKLRQLQEMEYKTILNSALGAPISSRKIGKFFNENNPFIATPLRIDFAHGFEEGYDSQKRGEISNEVDIGLIKEIFNMLRVCNQFTTKLIIASTGFKEDIISDDSSRKIKDDYFNGGLLNRIVQKHHKYQSNLYNGLENGSK